MRRSLSVKNKNRSQQTERSRFVLKMRPWRPCLPAKWVPRWSKDIFSLHGPFMITSIVPDGEFCAHIGNHGQCPNAHIRAILSIFFCAIIGFLRPIDIGTVTSRRTRWSWPYPLHRHSSIILKLDFPCERSIPIASSCSKIWFEGGSLGFFRPASLSRDWGSESTPRVRATHRFLYNKETKSRAIREKWSLSNLTPNTQS
jgi:hypothetical protein